MFRLLFGIIHIMAHKSQGTFAQSDKLAYKVELATLSVALSVYI